MATLRAAAANALENTLLLFLAAILLSVTAAFWILVAVAAAVGLWEAWDIALGLVPTVQDGLAGVFPAWGAWQVASTVAGFALALVLPFVLTCLALLGGFALVVGDGEGLDHAIPYDA